MCSIKNTDIIVQFGGCGLGGGFGYGWFALGLGMPWKSFSDLSGRTQDKIDKRFEQEMMERETRANKQLPCEQIDEETVLDERMKQVLESIEKRRERMRRKHEQRFQLF